MGWSGPGFVGKGSCDSDARITYAVLTDAGLDKLRDASTSHVAQIREFFEQRFDPNELATLADLLGRLPEAPGDGEDCAPPE